MRWSEDSEEEVGVARSSGSHAGSPPPKECAVWLAASTSSLERATQEMEEFSQEGPPADWY